VGAHHAYSLYPHAIMRPQEPSFQQNVDPLLVIDSLLQSIDSLRSTVNEVLGPDILPQGKYTLFKHMNNSATNALAYLKGHSRWVEQQAARPSHYDCERRKVVISYRHLLSSFSVVI
jgi:hypothetical protein